MVKFAYIKEVNLEDPNKCDGCIFQGFPESGVSMAISYCNATEEGFLINTPSRPAWCPLVLNYKEALSTSEKLLNECLEWDNGGERAYSKIVDFVNFVNKELGKNESR